MTTKKLYTVIIFSENTVGLLNQITIIFTRRQLNIETLSVSPSAVYINLQSRHLPMKI